MPIWTVSLLKLAAKYWFVPVIAGLTFWVWVQHKDVKLARAERDQAMFAAELNKKAVERIRRDQLEAERVAAEAVAEANRRVAEVNKHKQELRSAPDYNEPAGATFDLLSRQLRGKGPGH